MSAGRGVVSAAADGAGGARLRGWLAAGGWHAPIRVLGDRGNSIEKLQVRIEVSEYLTDGSIHPVARSTELVS